MAEFARLRVLVFTAGALGDFVLTWPLLRALTHDHADVTLIARDSHARLAARTLGVRAIGEERPEVTGLWSPSPDIAALRDRWDRALDSHRPDIVLSFIADPATAPGATWCANVRAALAPREVIFAGPPASASRRRLWTRARVDALGATPTLPRPRPASPPVLHVGAGDRSKVWPIDRWAELVRSVPALQHAMIIAGEVERERFDPPTLRLFDTLGGRFLRSLDELADLLIGSPTGGPAPSLFIGADTGPTHLAAQLGLPTLALFGPTDPAVWSPVGPHVRVIRAPLARMDALEPTHVRSAIEPLLNLH